MKKIAKITICGIVSFLSAISTNIVRANELIVMPDDDSKTHIEQYHDLMSSLQSARELLANVSSDMDIFSSIGYSNSYKYSKKKEYNESYSVSAKDRLSITNKLGNVTIEHWSKKEVKVNVVVESKSNSESDAQKAINKIAVDINKKENTISCVTDISGIDFIHNKQEISINYTVYIPKDFECEINAKYGNVTMPSTENGKNSVFDIKYGNFQGGGFENVNISSAYGSVILRDSKSANVELMYSDSDGNISNVQNLKLVSKYSVLTLSNIEGLDLESKYDKLYIDNLGSTKCNLKYSTLTIDNLGHALDCQYISYGKLVINNVDKGFDLINVAAKYSEVKINMKKIIPCKVYASNYKYGHCKVSGFNKVEKVTVQNSDDDDSWAKNNDKVNLIVNGGIGGIINLDGGKYSTLYVTGE